MNLHRSLRIHCIVATIVTTLLVWIPISVVLYWLGIIVIEDHHFGIVMASNVFITHWYVNDKEEFTEFDFMRQKRVPISFYKILKVSAVVQLFAFIIPLVSMLFSQ